MKFGEVRRRLRAEGFLIIDRDGSHEQWKRPGRPGRVTVGGKDGRVVPTGTLRNISRQAGWEWR
jgi:predicted RNA binding protein YcfA (HicA-like mRNA interferase family)